MKRRELLLLVTGMLFLIVLALPAVAQAPVNGFIPIGNGLSKISVITFPQFHVRQPTIEQNQSIIIQYGIAINSSDAYAVYHYVPGYIEVTVTTPKGENYTYANIHHPSQWIFPSEFGGSTSEVGNYSVNVFTYGLVSPGNVPVQDSQYNTFEVVPKYVPSPFITPALSVLGLGIATLLGFGFLARFGVVSDRGLFRRIKSPFVRLGFLANMWIWVPVFLLTIVSSYVVFPTRISPIIIISVLVVGLWGLQTLFSQYFYFYQLLRRYEQSSALYVFGWMSVALHEVSHAIISVLGGMGIESIKISPYEGEVRPTIRSPNFRTWLGVVYGGLAPAYFFPAILLILWFAFSGNVLNLQYSPPTVDMFTPFNQFIAVSLVNFFYWAVVNYANPLMYVFMYFLVTSSLSAGPSLPDWKVAWQAIRERPSYALGAIVAFFGVLSLVAVLYYDAAVSFIGFLVLLFVVVLLSEIVGFIFTRMTLWQGIALMVVVILVNGLAGFIITAWTPFIHQVQCALNSFYC